MTVPLTMCIPIYMHGLQHYHNYAIHVCANKRKVNLMQQNLHSTGRATDILMSSDFLFYMQRSGSQG